MLILIDPRTYLAVQPGDISAMRIIWGGVDVGTYLLLMLASGEHIKVHEDLGRREPRLDIKALHQRLLEASK